VESCKRRVRSSRWQPVVIEFVKSYVKDHPCFYIEELKADLSNNFPDLNNISESTICRALRFDLQFSRKVLTKLAKERSKKEIADFMFRLKYYYKRQDQVVFIDETSKDGRSAHRRFAWSKIGTQATANIPFSRGKRVSVLAAVSVEGFFGWHMTEGTFDRKAFHKAMIEKIIPSLNPYPLPRSLVVLDNAKIHMYKELIDAVNAIGAQVIFLPPYCPHLNPIEFCFSLLKRWINKKANIVFSQQPQKVLDIALRRCTRNEFIRKTTSALDLYPDNPNGP
jgi:transposase